MENTKIFNKVNTFYWLPRVFGILFMLMISLLAFDIEKFSWVVLLTHLLPSFVLLIVLIVAWFKEKIGGILWIALGIIYIFIVRGSVNWNAYLAIAGSVVVIGVLFLVSAKSKSVPVIPNSNTSESETLKSLLK